MSHGVIQPRKLPFVCVKRPTSPGSAFTSRDHRRWMYPPGGDKRACERLKVHTAFLLWFFFFFNSRNSENIWMRQKCGPVTVGDGARTPGFKLHTSKEHIHAWDVPSKIFHINVALESLDNRPADTARQLVWFSRLVAGVYALTVVARIIRTLTMWFCDFSHTRWGDDPILTWMMKNVYAFSSPVSHMALALHCMCPCTCIAIN